MNPTASTARAAVWYRRLLRAYPVAFREAFGEQMVDAFSQQHAEASRLRT